MSERRSKNPLHRLCVSGTPQQVEEYLRSPNIATQLNEPDKKGRTPLMLAAKALNIEACALLLEHDAIDVNVLDASGRTALHYVCATPPAQVSRSLALASGALSSRTLPQHALSDALHTLTFVVGRSGGVR